MADDHHHGGLILQGVVDAVLYLMPPHHVDPKDVAVITSLSQHAPIIPLLAKVHT